MKIRAGFVSNSSSSSYILAYKQGNTCAHCGRSDIDVAAVFRDKTRDYGDDTYIRAEGVQAVIEKLKEEYEDEISYSRDTEEDREYKQRQFVKFASHSSKIAKFVDQGYNIMYINVAYSDGELFESLLKQIDHHMIDRWA